MTTTAETVLNNTIKRCRELGIVVPTFAQMREPPSADGRLGERLGGTGLSDSDPVVCQNSAEANAECWQKVAGVDRRALPQRGGAGTMSS